ncbi:MAG: hypothetical protein IJV75_00325 [Alphaproteobacteria bacterium]|nr:hypothetical protein [Alphaproteobacteria bacterium]
MYQVIVKGEVVKEYPDKYRCYIYCHTRGYIMSGKGYYFLVGATILENTQNGAKSKMKGMRNENI